jgi:hypothetical protein
LGEPPPPERKGGLTAGVGFYLIKPYFSSNPAAVRTTTSTGVAGTATTTSTAISQSDFSQGFTFSPRGWIGYSLCSGLGVRLSYWRFDQGSQYATTNQNNSLATVSTVMAGPLLSNPPVLPGVQDQITATNVLRLDVYDLDVTQLFEGKCWWLLVGGGARYLYLNQSYSATLLRQGAAAPPFSGQAFASNAFTGVGPTLFVEAHRALGQKGFGLYGNARGAVLFGSGSQSTFGSINSADPTGATFANLTTVTGSRDSVVPVAELELGAEWAPRCGKVNPFLRVGAVGMNYFTVGNALSNGINNHDNLGFFGLTVTGGLSF